MPCFKGLAISIHTPEGPLPEHSVQKQSRFSRISTYIPVPPAKIPNGSNAPEPSTFAISVTLLTPGLNVPYSTPKPTPENPYPRPRVVGGLPALTGDRGHYGAAIGPYIPLTTSPNETIAAYIYFDGRAKEEVATLLRRGEETWVNSRWVGVPESEGGGLAEREFLFREVGLERWLNGLDLEGKDTAAKIERRRQKVQKKRRRRKESRDADDDLDARLLGARERLEKGILRYGPDERSPLEQMSDDDGMFSSDSDSDDDPVPEAAGQIKVALFRVLASGEIKKGEYSPQFDAHDDEESVKDMENGAEANGQSTEEVDHTTSFARPKTLDPKSISTQTVTGIDGPDRPFAVFTFLYRGARQLEKMGIIPSAKPSARPTTSTAKRRSVQTDFADLQPLKPGGTLGFSAFRETDQSVTAKKKTKKGKSSKSDSDMDSEDDEYEDAQEKPLKKEEEESLTNTMLSPEDAKRQGEIAEGVQKIRLKRNRSTSPNPASPSPALLNRNSPSPNNTTAGSTPPHISNNIEPTPTLLPSVAYEAYKAPEEAMVGSPLKRARASLPGIDDEMVKERFGLGGLGLSGLSKDILAESEKGQDIKLENKDEEL